MLIIDNTHKSWHLADLYQHYVCQGGSWVHTVHVVQELLLLDPC